MDTIHHDPRTKQQIKDAIYDFLYRPVHQQFQNRIEDLIMRNTLLGGYTHKHFMYKGEVYNCDMTNPPIKKNRLVLSLKPDMDSYLHDLQKLNNEELPYVLGFLNRVLNASNGLSDYLLVLPESVHQPIIDFIKSCPCSTHHLSPDAIDELKSKNADSIALIKRRMLSNLLI